MRVQSMSRASHRLALWTMLSVAAGCGRTNIGPEAYDAGGTAADDTDGDGTADPNEAGGADAKTPVDRKDQSDAASPRGRDGDAGVARGGGGGRGSGAGGEVGADGCNQVDISFEASAPTVFILVDRSSSMFDQNFWEPLKQGVLTVVERLTGEVRFGFATYTGRQGGVCPELTPAATIAEGNFEAIRTAYESLGAPTYKGETPTALALEQISDQLATDPTGGSKYILLVTDGEPDFCDDPAPTCPRDAVVAAVQAAYGRGIGTFIFSLGHDVEQSHLQDVANAGTGQPVEDHQAAVLSQCLIPRATYSSTSGNAPYFEPNVDPQTLLSALTKVIAGVRSCVFELQGQLEIDPGAADQGVVEIDGVRVPYGVPDGYRMNSPTELELLGSSCERLRSPSSQRVSIDFPCGAIVVI